MMTRNKRLVSMWLPTTTIAELKSEASRRGTSMSAVIREAIGLYLHLVRGEGA